MSDNTPTLRLPTTPPPAPPSVPPPAPPPAPPSVPPGRPSRGPLVAFILLSVLVLVAASVLVYVLFGRTSGNTQTQNSPGATTTSAPAVPSQPPPPPGVFTEFTVPQSQQCRGHGGDHREVDAQISWATTNARQVWVAEGTTDAQAAGSEQVPLSGDQDAFPTPLPLDCNSRSMTFTMTLVGDDGAHVSRTWTVLIDGRHD